MKRTFWSLLAAIVTVFGTLCSLYPFDVWTLRVFRPYAGTSRLRRWMFNYPPAPQQILH